MAATRSDARRPPPGARLDQPVKFLKGIGERRAEALARLGVHTARDLLFHLPHRYLDASTVTPLARARAGADVACLGTVIAKGILPTRQRLRIFHAVLQDASGLLECTWPGQPFLDRTIEVGQQLLVQGTVRFFHGRQLQVKEFLVVGQGQGQGPGAEGQGPGDGPGAPGSRPAAPSPPRIIPIYPATDGLTHRQVRALVDQHLDALLELVDDPMPDAERRGRALMRVRDALRAVHRPVSLEEAEDGRRRLAFDELLDLQLMLARARWVAKRGQAGIAFPPAGELSERLLASLPWPLTGDQRTALEQIGADMGAPARMHRLLMGDVGTGKTIVAFAAMLRAIEHGWQAALMAPTELLAEQHAAALGRFGEAVGVQPLLLVGRLTAAEKADARRRVASGAARLVVGTHALVQEATAFHRLGLVVIDEQHRFGVEQRAALLQKGSAPDTLLLSATPIPRSLALTLYGDLDVSTLRERPPGRTPIRTAVRTEPQRQRVLDFVRAECGAGRQAYVVLPVIEESATADLRAAATMQKELEGRWPELRVGLVHGRLKAPEREAVMRDFRAGAVNVLVATTVIEVGIDVPNASVMVVEHPERFGLAQLHQLRGRVGRGAAQSYCILLGGDGVRRLQAFARTEDGFRIAELDLKARGMGNLIGARQSGDADVRLARLPDDLPLLEAARAEARALLDRDPTLQRREHAALRARALARFPRAVELFRVG
ncbi:MAG: ATP-dependent DNA helicase RecG [Gemmatimonadales bacterium]|nr:ATP-dependent DNA helicase RecG [Gemmatimonadales bacterium]